MILLLSNLNYFGCQIKAQPTVLHSTSETHLDAEIRLLFSWDVDHDAPWPVGGGFQFWFQPSYLSFGGAQLLPCVNSSTEILNNSTSEFTMAISEPLHELENREIGVFAAPTGAFCEVYVWYDHPELKPHEWPESLGVDGVLHLSGRWGSSFEEATLIELFTSEARGHRIRLIDPLILDEGDSATLNLFRDRQYMLDQSLLESEDIDLILSAFVEETQVLVLYEE